MLGLKLSDALPCLVARHTIRNDDLYIFTRVSLGVNRI
jgi:hypothetical protein